MRKDVKEFLLKQGLTERELEYRPNFTFMKVELMLQNALDQGQILPLDGVSVSLSDFLKESKKGGYIIAIKDDDGLISTQGNTKLEALENMIDAYKTLEEYRNSR